MTASRRIAATRRDPYRENALVERISRLVRRMEPARLDDVVSLELLGDAWNKADYVLAMLTILEEVDRPKAVIASIGLARVAVVVSGARGETTVRILDTAKALRRGAPIHDEAIARAREAKHASRRASTKGADAWFASRKIHAVNACAQACLMAANHHGRAREVAFRACLACGHDNQRLARVVRIAAPDAPGTEAILRRFYFPNSG